MSGAIAEKSIGREGTGEVEGATPDEVLLARFLDDEGSSSQDAFRLLVERHGPRVLGICRHVLDREHDAEDAFQATFLTLARNGASIRDRCALARWLNEVAHRTALKTRARRSRRQTVERQSRELQPLREEPDDQGERAFLAELRPVLHEEVTGLPDKYRIPVILSYLEGKTNEEVAALLEWPVGTVKGRLSRGRALLRSRLTRRGVALSSGTLLLALSGSRVEAADVSGELLRSTLEQAFGAGKSAVLGDSASNPAQDSSTITSSDGPSDPGPGPDDGSVSKAARRRTPHEPSESTESVPGSSPARDAGGLRTSRIGRLVSAALVLLLAFSGAVFVGGFVSAAAYGGKLPSLRSALRELMPARSLSPTAPAASCHSDSDSDR
jgi:RNA polymerase sigma factor (sigma-70 family)